MTVAGLALGVPLVIVIAAPTASRGENVAAVEQRIEETFPSAQVASAKDVADASRDRSSTPRACRAGWALRSGWWPRSQLS